ALQSRRLFATASLRGGAGLAGGGFGGVYAPGGRLALFDIDYGCKEMGAVEVGPENFGDEDFGVGNLPEEKIADAHFAAGANEKIGIRKIGGVEMAGELTFGDWLRGAVAVALGEEGVHGVDDFGAASVIEGDRENHAGVAGGSVRGFARVFLNGRGKLFGAPEETHTDIVLLKKRHFFTNVLTEKLHEEFNFGLGAAPVFDRESVESECFNMQARAGFDGGACGFRACAMPGDA